MRYLVLAIAIPGLIVLGACRGADQGTDNVQGDNALNSDAASLAASANEAANATIGNSIDTM